MKLVPREIEKLMLHNAGHLAQKRLARGKRLNYTESVALIATQVTYQYFLYIYIYMYISSFSGSYLYICIDRVGKQNYLIVRLSKN